MVMIPKPPRFLVNDCSPVSSALRSMPAEKLPPAPVSTATRSCGSSSKRSSASDNAWLSAALNAFFACGRLSVSTSTCSRTSYFRTSSFVSLMTPSLDHREAAADSEHLAGYVLRVVRRQKRDRVRHVTGAREALQAAADRVALEQRAHALARLLVQ